MSDGSWSHRPEEHEPGGMRVSGFLFAALLRIWGATWRIDEDRERLEALRAKTGKGAVILSFWHNRLVMFTYGTRGRGFCVLRSSSKDGRLIAAVLERLGTRSVAGSTSRGGAAGLRALVKLAREGVVTAVTVDGPRGPRGRVKSGIIQLAALSGLPIIPSAAAPRRARLLGSWDRTILPLPFTRIKMRYGMPIHVERPAGKEEIERARAELERSMTTLTDELDIGQGRTPIAPSKREAGSDE